MVVNPLSFPQNISQDVPQIFEIISPPFPNNSPASAPVPPDGSDSESSSDDEDTSYKNKEKRVKFKTCEIDFEINIPPRSAFDKCFFFFKPLFFRNIY